MDTPVHIKQRHWVPTGISQIRFSDYVIDIFTDIPSRKGIKKAIKKGAFLIDDQLAHSGDWVQAGQCIDWIEVEEAVAKVFPMEVEVCFEDDYLAIVNKPAGYIVNGNQYQTLENCLPHNLQASPLSDALAQPRTTHRLDKATSGLVLVAKTAKARVAIGQLFEKRQIHKTYSTIVQGSTPAEATLEEPIDGQKASTTYRKIKEVPSLKDGFVSQLEVHPLSGRTHQIRKHLANTGFPIVGDSLYGQEGNMLRGKGLFLAAIGLQFVHPLTQKQLSVSIEMPAKFRSLLEREERRFSRYEVRGTR